MITENSITRESDNLNPDSELYDIFDINEDIYALKNRL